MKFRIGHTVEVVGSYNHNSGKTGVIISLYGVLPEPFNKTHAIVSIIDNHDDIVSINDYQCSVKLTDLKRVRIEPAFAVQDEVVVNTYTHPMNGATGVVVQKWHSGGRSQYLVVDGNYGIFNEDELSSK
ncbi:hypothetical protein YenMTG1_016 [Yersinia phage vB_YenM_TG1]|uniref:Uncharacterized protein n=1 Tax=Yersinia phage vB_YenM_TG1 TaxID=1589265 RepID=A0A0B5A2D0_9CAUD|nr:hypothetical protein AVV33_gp016 [Yersinia phage vB_YenM_TG1]AJD81825.1 hypothetical protein YenMTG1_016 [Yersinia phage vB_YenM_TG1]